MLHFSWFKTDFNWEQLMLTVNYYCLKKKQKSDTANRKL